MEALLRSLAQHSAETLLVLVVVVLALAVFTVSLARRYRRSTDRWRELLRDSRGESLEALLSEHLRERTLLDRDLRALRDRVAQLEERLAVSKRHMGLVRFDAFEEVHGNQSFALALYDDQGNGAVVSSIVGRSDCRVYCKPLVSGRSERNLSQEEQRAIAEATAPGVKSIVSP
jgi:hypothetical protein